MRYDPNIHRRCSIRLKDYNYSQSGEYFVTICTQDHICLFGAIYREEMCLSPIGEIAKRCWEDIPNHFPNVDLDKYVIMPNHIHGIIIIKENDHGMDVQQENDSDHGRDVQLNVPTRLSPKKGTLSIIIRTYKAAVTTECRRIGHNEFRWQSRFYEHIIRDDWELEKIRNYIVNNPLQWQFDEENSDTQSRMKSIVGINEIKN